QDSSTAVRWAAECCAAPNAARVAEELRDHAVGWWAVSSSDHAVRVVLALSLCLGPRVLGVTCGCLVNRRCSRFFDDRHMRKVSEIACVVHAVPDHELVSDREANIVYIHGHLATRQLVEQRRDADRSRLVALQVTEDHRQRE